MFSAIVHNLPILNRVEEDIVKRCVNRLPRVALTLLFAVFLLAPYADAGPVRYGANGALCSHNNHCTSGYCADGQRCAPRDGTGASGAYCHHNNHCASGLCRCNKGGFGFCRDWERWPEGVFDSSSAQSPYIQIGFCN